MTQLMQIIKNVCMYKHKSCMLPKYAKKKKNHQRTNMACVCSNIYKRSMVTYIMLKKGDRAIIIN